ncbi:bifunctional GNAT family N-acetyltransferase/acetate--CoA ligase family protein [Rothia nasimurium]|uniref:bifunctional acetate--CoA ligase family protein/GNAT family N-acetyltransferase n=1 Tax=Rothia nasimurium TaxID=85336 RepID=UPI001F00BCD7|nr:bifunctional GNAT family N-acetyltransferase/acetate--CoA ligase family protein [Rothia nasimurium]
MTGENRFTPADPAHPTTAEIPFIYPEHWEADVVLRDGATAHLRPVVPTDRGALEKMYAGQSENTIYLRFFTHKPTLSDQELTRFTTVDHQDRVAFVIMLGEEMIGIGRFDRTHLNNEAEVAFMISDAHQGRGIGSILLEHLAAAAHERGIDRFSAEVLPQNRKMLNVFTDAGYEISREFEDGLVMVHFNIDPTEKSQAVREAREHRAEAKSIAELIAPNVVAVIGTADKWESNGQKVIDNIVDGGFTGTLVGVNSAGHPAGDTPIFTSLAEVPHTIDLAIVAVPLTDVADVVEACGEAGVRGALIYTSGFADDGARGRARQKALVKSARKYGMRIIGPASFGLLNNDPAIKLDATISSQDPKPGALGLFSQSSAIGAMFSNTAVKRGIGVSSLISAGNRADVSGNDIMQYWEDDDATRVCALYLESIGNPRKFSRIARRLSRVKPVLVAKHAVTGQKLPPGHSGRTSIAPTGAIDAMFKQAGVISAETFDRVLDVAQIVVSQPLPAGRRVAILSNASALGQIVADKAEELRIDVRITESMLRLTDEGINGLDVLEDVATSALESSDIDAVLGVFLTGETISPKDVASVLLKASLKAGKPAIASFPGTSSFESALRGIWEEPGQDEPATSPETPEDGTALPAISQTGLPCFESPGASIQALAAVMDYVEWRDKETGVLAQSDGTHPKQAAATIARHLARINGEELLELTTTETEEVLAHYGIHLLPEYTFSTPDEAVAAAHEAGGYPVVLKTTDDVLRHRLDLGGVRLGIESDEELVREIAQMHRVLEPYGVFDLSVQQQVPGGQACVLTAIEDPLIGPVVSFGLAGDATSLLDDWAHRIPPLTERDVYKMIRSPKSAAKLFAAQDLPAVRVDLLEDLCVRVAQLKDNHPEIAYLELKPVLVSQDTVTVVGAKLRLGNPQQRTDSARRTMSR